MVLHKVMHVCNLLQHAAHKCRMAPIHVRPQRVLSAILNGSTVTAH